MRTGRQVTDAQVKEVRRHLNQGGSLRLAAMKADMDRKTARKYRDLGQLPSEAQAPHTWRTRPDPLLEVWPGIAELLCREPSLQAKTLLGWLEREHPGPDWHRHRRTLERRVRQWKAAHGPAKEIFFSQVHEPGRLGSSDFTHLDSLGVTIQGQPFPHLFYHFVLTHSNWEHVTLCFTESFASLSEGLQNALWALGGVPERHRTDRMTLAVHHDGNAEEYTARYQALLRHYGVTAEATNAYSAHENGDCEQSHRRFKEALAQELLLRGSRDFASREDYVEFVRALLARRNASRGERFQAEVARLGALPARRLETLERQRAKVGQGSTIQVKKNTYSVPSQLRGEWVEARIGAEVIEVWYAGSLVQTMERLRGQSKHRIDYRHVIAGLVRKPGAFARYVYREDLYPTLTFRRAYDALLSQQPGRADREYLQILQVAAQEGEACVAAVLTKLLDQGRPLSAQAVRWLLGVETPLTLAAQVVVPAVDLRSYDALLEGALCQDSDIAMSQTEPSKEASDEQGCDGGAGALPAGAASGDGAEPVRGGGSASGGGDLEPCGLSARAGGAREPAAAAQPHRAVSEGVAAGVGEELGDAGPEAPAGEGGPATAWSAERGFSGPAGERAGVRPAGFGEDARGQCGGAGAGACGSAAAVHQVQPAGAGVAEGEARPGPEGAAASTVALAGSGHRRSRLRAAQPGGNGGAVHAVGGTLRAGQRAGDQQPGVLGLGADFQGSDDYGGGDRPAGAPQCDHRDERAELSCGVGEAGTGRAGGEGRVRKGERWPGWGSGSAALALAALWLAPLRQTPTPARFASGEWGILIVANGEG